MKTNVFIAVANRVRALLALFAVVTAPCSVTLGQTDSHAATETQPTEKQRPNVVVIVSDDHRWDLMSCQEHPIVKTPNLDRLASEGVMFRNAFATSGVCSPSRGSILTGKYAHQAGTPQIIWMNNLFRAQEIPFPARLHDAGYHTAHVGKWHLGRGDLGMPGYDHWAGFEWLGEYFDTTMTVDGEVKHFKGFADDIISNHAAEYIKERAGSNQPFCVYVGLKSPHLNFSYPPRHEHLLDGVDIPKPDSFEEDYEKSGRLPFLKNVLDVTKFVGGIPMFDNSWEKYVKSYYRSSQAIDDAVGTIMGALDEAGITDDTIVLYTSDQGYTLGEHGLCEKHFSHEEALRVPMLVRWPKLGKPGSRRDELVLNIDIAPTILDLCGVRSDDSIPGRSMKPLLAAGDQPVDNWREDFFFETASIGDQIPGQVTVRTHRYKLITYPWISKPWCELYDLAKDPHESKNVADEPAYADIRKEMEGRLERLKSENDWSKIVEMPIESFWVLGPVEDALLNEVRAQVVDEPFFDVRRNRIKAGDKEFVWSKHVVSEGRPPGNHALDDVIGETPGGTLFVAIPIRRHVDRSPFVWLPIRPVIPMKGYVNGRKYHDTPGGEGPVENLMASYNPPLLAERNLFILEFPAHPWIWLRLFAPEGSVELTED